MDLSKVGRSLPFTFATMKEIDVLICEGPPDEDMRKAAKLCGVEIYTSV